MPTLKELAQLGKEALLAFVAQLLTEFSALKTRVAELLEELAALKARVAELLAENVTLKAQLEQRTRDAKRQAAPFSKGQRTAQPKRPGRKPGQGPFTFRTLPTPDQWTAPPIEVRLPEPICPCCGEALLEQRVDFAATTEIPPQPQPIVQPFRVWVYRCPTCETTVRAPHPDLAPDQSGATAHRMGPRVMAAAHATHYGLGVPVRKVPAVPEAIRNRITIWYFTASPGSTPANNCPVIIPGRLTPPATIMALRIGIIPARIASRTAGRAASQRLAPNAREVSTSSRRPTSSPPRRSSPSEIPVRVLPKIM